MIHRIRLGRRAPALGFTLIEMLISLTVTLIMMGAVVSLFGVMTDSVAGSRALIEAGDRLRSCRNRLQTDLQGYTATLRPPLRPENDEGYFEVIEGENFDNPNNNGIANTANGRTLFGDLDDAISFTSRSRGEPFIVSDGSVSFTSQVAEITYYLAPAVDPPNNQVETVMDASATPPTLWWMKTPYRSMAITPSAPTRLYNLFRHVRIVSPSTASPNNLIVATTTGASPVAATLGDLTKPENRFSRVFLAGTYPSRFTVPVNRGTDDIILTNVLSFDVQVWDPGAPLNLSNGVVVEPRDQGWTAPTPANATAFGAYVDLGYAYTPPATPAPPVDPSFNLVTNIKPHQKSAGVNRPFTYDTWSLHYENDGVQQRGTVTDGGTNGIDDDNNGIVDDQGEFDTLPPYSSPLRGVRITIRIYEPSSQQVRQITVVQDFLPE